MSSCPVCYESFSDLGGETAAHKLSCGDIICCSCIRSNLHEGEYYCPECGNCYKGSVMEDFSVALHLADLTPKYTSDDGTSDDEHSTSSRSNSADSSPRSANRSFKYAFGAITTPIRTPCKYPNCDKKAFGNGYCLKHSKRLSKSVVGLEKIAMDMLEHHDLRNFTSSSRSLRKTDQQRARTSVFSDLPALLEKFKAQERLELGETLELIMRAKAVMSREPNILRLDAPVIVVGDIHGQFFDLVNILNEAAKSAEAAGKVDSSGPTFLFLGDYVDRGHYSCEVMLYLLALKVANPEKVWLVRGNHECASVSAHFGFKQECKMKYGVNIYYSFLLLFQTMPLGAIITTAFGDIYACHGGLSPWLTTIEEIESLDRMVEPESNPSLMDILWADPISDENVENMTPEEYREFIEIDWRPNPARGCSYCYGYRSVKTFLQKNALVCLVRAHEVQEEGYRKHFAPEIMEAKIVTLQQKLDRAALAHAAANAAVNKQSSTKTFRAFSSEAEDWGDLSDSDTLSDHSTTEPCTPKSDQAEPSTSRPPSERVPLQRGTSAVDFFHNKRSSPYRPDTSSTASIEQPEDFPPVITIFSAPNYCDRYQNKGAILLIDSALDGFRVIQYDCVEHPKPEVVESQTKTLIDLVISTCPYMPTSFRNFVQLAVELGEDLEFDSESDSDSVVALPVAVGVDIDVDVRDGVGDGGAGEEGGATAFEEAKGVSGEESKIATLSGPASPNAPRTGKRPQSASSPQAAVVATVSWAESTAEHTADSAAREKLSLDLDTAADGPEDTVCAPSLPTPSTPRQLTRRASKTISLVRQSSLSSSAAANNTGFDGPESPNANKGEKTISMAGPDSTGSSQVAFSPMMRELSSGVSFSDIDVHIIDEDLEYHAPSSHMIPLVSHAPSSIANSAPREDGDANQINNNNNNTNNNVEGRSSRKKSNVYIQALASDSINEVHPQRLNLYLEQFKKTYEASSKKGFQISLFELSSDEKPAISVNDLKTRFERKSSMSDSFSSNTNERRSSQVVHDFERGTGISNIMNMFGGSGRLTNLPKTRTSFPFPLPDHRFGAGDTSDTRKCHSECTSPTGRAEARTAATTAQGSDHDQHHHHHGAALHHDQHLQRRQQHFQEDDSAAISTTSPGRFNSIYGTTEGSKLFGAHTTTTEEHNLGTNVPPPAGSSGDGGGTSKQLDSVLFSQSEIMGLRLMFSLFDRSGSNKITYEDLVAYAEETDDAVGIRNAGTALEILDLDGDGFIGLLDFIYFARRLKKMQQTATNEHSVSFFSSSN